MWQLAARAVDRGGKGKRQKEGSARGEDNKAKALSTSASALEINIDFSERRSLALHMAEQT